MLALSLLQICMQAMNDEEKSVDMEISLEMALKAWHKQWVARRCGSTGQAQPSYSPVYTK